MIVSQERIRSFIAVDLDEPTLRERITNSQRGLEQTGAQLKLVNPNIMHLTLRFLGEIPRTAVEGVKEALSGLQFKAFEAHFSGLGVFPSMKRISVVWVGMTRGSEQLNEIFQQLEPKIRQLGIPADSKGFSPHLTIARVRSGVNRDALAEYVSSMRDHEFGSMQVTSVRLKKSTLTPKGPIYETLQEARAVP